MNRYEANKYIVKKIDDAIQKIAPDFSQGMVNLIAEDTYSQEDCDKIAAEYIEYLKNYGLAHRGICS